MIHCIPVYNDRLSLGLSHATNSAQLKCLYYFNTLGFSLLSSLLLLFLPAQVLLKHCPTKWMDGFKVISVNEDLKKFGSMLS